MSPKRVFYGLAGSLALLSGLMVAGIVVGNGMLEKSATRLNELKLQTGVIDEKQNSLAQAKRDIEKYTELEKIAKSVVPQEKDQARTVREIVKFAEESEVPITSITFPSSELGTAQKDASPISQVIPVEGIRGVYQLDVTIQNDKDSAVTYPSLISFLSKLEQNRRTSQVNSLSLQPDPLNRNQLTYTMIITVYIRPE